MATMEDEFQFVDITAPMNRMNVFVEDEHHDESGSESESDVSDNEEYDNHKNKNKNRNANANKMDKTIVAVSDLNTLKKEVTKQLSDLKLQQQKNEQEYQLLQTLKKELTTKISNVDTLINTHTDAIKSLKNEASQYTKMSEDMKKEMTSLRDLRKLTDAERNELKGDRDKLNRQVEHFKKDCSQLDDILSKLSIVPEYVQRNKEINNKLNAFYTETTEMEKEVTRLQELRAQQQDLIKQAKIDLETMRSDHIANCLKEFDKSVAYSCKECGTHIAIEADIESRCYQVGQGTFSEKKRGYLFKTASNLELGPTKTENFTTGSYKISWVTCVKCHQSMGWKYLSADNPNNTSKVGKYCLARYSLHSPQERSES